MNIIHTVGVIWSWNVRPYPDVLTTWYGISYISVTSGGGSSSQETYVIVELGGMERRSPGYEISATMLSPKYGYESVQM